MFGLLSKKIVAILRSLFCLTRPKVKPVLSGHSKRRPKIGFQDRLSLNTGQKYCKHSVILSTFIKLPFVFKILFCLFLSGRFRQVLLYVVFFEGCSPGALVSPEGGSMMIQDGDGTSFMAEAIFICNSDYELSENSYSRFCLSDGSWSGTDPTCDPIGM